MIIVKISRNKRPDYLISLDTFVCAGLSLHVGIIQSVHIIDYGRENLVGITNLRYSWARIDKSKDFGCTASSTSADISLKTLGILVGNAGKPRLARRRRISRNARLGD